MADKLIDARNLSCPLPILKTSKAIKAIAIGGTVELLATDPGAIADVAAFCEKGRHTLVEQSEAAGVHRFVIRRGR